MIGLEKKKRKNSLILTRVFLSTQWVFVLSFNSSHDWFVAFRIIIVSMIKIDIKTRNKRIKNVADRILMK